MPDEDAGFSVAAAVPELAVPVVFSFLPEEAVLPLSVREAALPEEAEEPAAEEAAAPEEPEAQPQPQPQPQQTQAAANGGKKPADPDDLMAIFEILDRK